MRVGIFLPSWIGDACMATPAVRAVREHLPDAELIAVSRPGPAALLAGSPWFSEWLIYKPGGSRGDLGRRQLVRRLRQTRLDAMLLLPNSLSAAAIAFAARIPRRIGFAKDCRGLLLTDRLRRQRGTRPLIDSYLELTRPLGCLSEDRRMELPLAEDDIELCRRLKQSFGCEPSRPTVVVNNSAASAASRLWPSQYVVHLCRRLVASTEAQILLHCGPNDREATNAVWEQVNSPRVVSMGQWPELPLGLTKAVIAEADAVVSSDSGPRHIAAAFSRPLVSFFGPTDPRATQTFNAPEAVLEAFEECRPCGKTECPLKHHRCMRNIEVDAAFAAVLEALDRGRGLRIAA